LTPGNLVKLNPNIDYDIDWITGRIISDNLSPYYFEYYELLIIINIDDDYLYLLNNEGKLIKTPYKDYFIAC
jgi:hypothetical protein